MNDVFHVRNTLWTLVDRAINMEQSIVVAGATIVLSLSSFLEKCVNLKGSSRWYFTIMVHQSPVRTYCS